MAGANYNRSRYYTRNSNPIDDQIAMTKLANQFKSERDKWKQVANDLAAALSGVEDNPSSLAAWNTAYNAIQAWKAMGGK